MELKVIAYARNGHTDKFGIPRQSREDSPIVTRIVFEPEYVVAEALRGIEGYSHLWLLWGFSEVTDTPRTAESLSWSPTVRPPRLGGNKRMGVFATRSPFRPNPIGLSSVRLLGVHQNGKSKNINDEVHPIHGESGRLELIVTGADLLDGTPIYDIKPYLSFSDCHPEAVNGFAEETKDYGLRVMEYGLRETEKGERIPEEVLRDIEYILRQDPRPAYQDDPARAYKMDYAGYTITFFVENQTVLIKNIEKLPN